MTQDRRDEALDTGRATPSPSIPYRTLFLIFLKAGLAFGGGLGILTVFEDELVSKRKLISREEFLTLYGIGRIVPSGTMTALAVAFGHRLAGLPGTAIALIAMVLPAFAITVALTLAYGSLREGPFLALLAVTILPAALAFIAGAALKLGKDVFRPSWDLVLAVAAFAGAFAFDLNPSLLLIAGGVLGILAFRRSREKEAAE